MVKLRHIDCQNPTCGICLEDHLALGKELARLTGNNKVDHLGKIHKWMRDNGKEPETEWGWATVETFWDSTIEHYVKWYRGKDGE